MKLINTLKVLTGIAAMISLGACEPKKQEGVTDQESVEVAKEANDSTFEDRDDEKDADFIVNAVASNYAEIKIAQLANNKATDPKVKDIATMLEKDHTKVLNELKAYANKNGITVPMAENESDAKELADLEKESGAEFDNEWCEHMKDRHEKTISKFEKRIDKTEDPELKSWISATLPGLKGHLDMLKTREEGAK
jgi:putative membrane protein